MKDPANALRVGYVTALTGNVTISEAEVQVYSYVPYGATEPHIYLGEIDQSDDGGTKSSYITNLTLLIDIYAQGANAKDVVDNISNQVLQIVISKTGGVAIGDDFKIVNSILENSSYITEETDSRYIVRKLLRVRHLIYENSIV